MPLIKRHILRRTGPSDASTAEQQYYYGDITERSCPKKPSAGEPRYPLRASTTLPGKAWEDGCSKSCTVVRADKDCCRRPEQGSEASVTIQTTWPVEGKEDGSTNGNGGRLWTQEDDDDYDDGKQGRQPGNSRQ